MEITLEYVISPELTPTNQYYKEIANNTSTIIGEIAYTISAKTMKIKSYQQKLSLILKILTLLIKLQS